MPKIAWHGEVPLTSWSRIGPSHHTEEKHRLNYIFFTNWTSSITNDIVVESLHDRAVFFEIESIELVFICGLIFRGDFFDDLNILIRVEGCEGFLSGLDIMELSEAIILNKGWVTISVKWLFS